MGRLTIGETFYIDRENKYSKTSRRNKSKPNRFQGKSKLPKGSKIANLLKTNYEDIHRQAERLTSDRYPTSETVVNTRYSHIPVNPGIPMEYYKEEPSFKHYKEINEQMLDIPKEVSSGNWTASRTPVKTRSTMAGLPKQIEYSKLRYSVEDVQLNFRNPHEEESRESLRSKLSDVIKFAKSQKKYDPSRLSTNSLPTTLFGKVLSTLQNSRIEVRISI